MDQRPYFQICSWQFENHWSKKCRSALEASTCCMSFLSVAIQVWWSHFNIASLYLIFRSCGNSFDFDLKSDIRTINKYEKCAFLHPAEPFLIIKQCHLGNEFWVQFCVFKNTTIQTKSQQWMCPLFSVFTLTWRNLMRMHCIFSWNPV